MAFLLSAFRNIFTNQILDQTRVPLIHHNGTKLVNKNILLKELFSLVYAPNKFKKNTSSEQLDASKLTAFELDTIVNSSNLFAHRTELTDVNLLPITSSSNCINFSSLSNGYGLFDGCTFFNQKVFTPVLINGEYMFHNCTSFNQEINAETCVNCKSMFEGCASFNNGSEEMEEGEVLDLSSATNCINLLKGCASFNQKVFIPNAINLENALEDCEIFDNVVIMHNAVNASGMFKNCGALSKSNAKKSIDTLPDYIDAAENDHVLTLPAHLIGETQATQFTSQEISDYFVNKGWTIISDAE